jgi:hypothetical protein
MAIPFATTTIAILRLSEEAMDGESYQTEVRSVFATGIRASISMSPQNRGEETTQGGERAKVKARLSCDPCDLRHTDQVVDLVTDDVWNVEYTQNRVGLGIDHVTAGLYRFAGRV